MESMVTPTKKALIPSRTKKPAYVGTFLELDDRLSLERIAIAKDVSISKVVRDAVREYLERQRIAA
jgi:hypothetical protein